MLFGTYALEHQNVLHRLMFCMIVFHPAQAQVLYACFPPSSDVFGGRGAFKGQATGGEFLWGDYPAVPFAF